MEIGNNWGAVDPSKLDTFTQLGQREQSAVYTALRGIQSWQEKRQEPKPIRVRITTDNHFNLRAYADVLHELGIGITDSLVRDKDQAITFQPRPYSRTFMPETDRDRFDAIREK